MLFSHRLSHRFLDYQMDGLPLFFASNLVRQIAMIFLGIFSPIYIYETILKSTFSSSLSLSLTLAFFAILLLVKLVILPLVERLGFRFGFKNVMLFSLPFFLAFVVALVAAGAHPLFLVAATLFWGLYDGLFWWGYHGFFIAEGSPKAFGRQISAFGVGMTVIVVASPILGGVIAQASNFTALFWTAAAAMTVSMLLLLPAKNPKPRVRVYFGDVVRLVWRHRLVGSAYAANAGEASLLGSVWPIFLLGAVGGTVAIGGIISIASFISAILIFLVGAWVDKQGKRGQGLLLAVGSPLIFATWFLRMFSKAVPFLIGIDASYRFVDQLVSLPLNILSYQKAAEEGIDRALMFYEITITLGALIVTVFLAVWFLLGGTLVSSFLIAALVALIPLLAVRKIVGVRE